LIAIPIEQQGPRGSGDQRQRHFDVQIAQMIKPLLLIPGVQAAQKTKAEEAIRDPTAPEGALFEEERGNAFGS